MCRAEESKLTRRVASEKLCFTADGISALSLVKKLMEPSPASPVLSTVPLKSSAVRAGWICLILGYLTFWIFGFGFLFFSVTFVLEIVAMCTNRVRQGIVLLVSSMVSILICALIFFFAIVGTVGVAAQKASEEIKRQQQAEPLRR